jgi:hypothetical protein
VDCCGPRLRDADRFRGTSSRLSELDSHVSKSRHGAPILCGWYAVCRPGPPANV